MKDSYFDLVYGTYDTATISNDTVVLSNKYGFMDTVLLTSELFEWLVKRDFKIEWRYGNEQYCQIT